MKRLEFIQKALDVGVEASAIKDLLDERRNRIGAFDDDPAATTTLSLPAAPTTPTPVEPIAPEPESSFLKKSLVETPIAMAKTAIAEPIATGRGLLARGIETVGEIATFPSKLGTALQEIATNPNHPIEAFKIGWEQGGHGPITEQAISAFESVAAGIKGTPKTEEEKTAQDLAANTIDAAMIASMVPALPAAIAKGVMNIPKVISFLKSQPGIISLLEKAKSGATLAAEEQAYIKKITQEELLNKITERTTAEAVDLLGAGEKSVTEASVLSGEAIPERLQTIVPPGKPIVNLWADEEYVLKEWQNSGIVPTVNNFIKFAQDKFNTRINKENAKAWFDMQGIDRPGRPPEIPVKVIYQQPKATPQQIDDAVSILDGKPPTIEPGTTPPHDPIPAINDAIANPKPNPLKLGKKEPDLLLPEDNISINLKKIQDEFVASGGDLPDWAKADRMRAFVSKWAGFEEHLYRTTLENLGMMGAARNKPVNVSEFIDNIAEMSSLTSHDPIIAISANIKKLKDGLRGRLLEGNKEGAIGDVKQLLSLLFPMRKTFHDVGKALQESSIEDPTGRVLNLSKAISKRLNTANSSLDDIEKFVAELQALDANDPKKLIDFVKKNTDKMDRLGSVVSTFRYVNMLSSPKTQIINLTGNFGNITTIPFVRLMSASLDAAFTAGQSMLHASKIKSGAMKARERTIFFKDFPTYYAGLLDPNSIRLGLQKFKTDFAAAPGYAWDIQPVVGEIFDKANVDVMQTAINKYSKTQSTWRKNPFKKIFTVGEFIPKLLNAVDGGMRTITEGGEYSLGYLQNMIREGKLTQAQAKTIAEEKGYQRVFRQKLFDPYHGGKGTATVNNFVDEITNFALKIRRSENRPLKILSSMIVPFVQTIAGIFKTAIEFTPFGFVDVAQVNRYNSRWMSELRNARDIGDIKDPNLIRAIMGTGPSEVGKGLLSSKEYGKQALESVGNIVLARSKEELYEKTSKAILGTTAMLGLSGIVAQSDVVGKLSSDPQLRSAQIASGMKEYSIKFPGTTKYRQFMQLPPFISAPLSILAAYKQKQMELSEENDSRAQRLQNNLESFFKASVIAPIQMFGQQSFVAGTQTVLEALSSGDEKKLDRATAGLARQGLLYAGLVSWSNQMMDDFTRKPDSWMDYIKKDIPFLSETVGKQGPVFTATVGGIPDIPVGIFPAERPPISQRVANAFSPAAAYERRHGVKVRSINFETGKVGAQTLDQILKENEERVYGKGPKEPLRKIREEKERELRMR